MGQNGVGRRARGCRGCAGAAVRRDLRAAVIGRGLGVLVEVGGHEGADRYELQAALADVGDAPLDEFSAASVALVSLVGTAAIAPPVQLPLHGSAAPQRPRRGPPVRMGG